MKKGGGKSNSEGKARRGEGVAESKPSHAAKEAAAAAAAAKAPAPAPALAKQGGGGNKGRQQHLTLSPGLVDWLATGVLLREAAKAEGLDKLLLDLGKEHFGQVYLQLRAKDLKGLLPLLEQQSRQGGATAANGGKGAAANAPPGGAVGFCFTNARPQVLLDPAKGAWEAAKVYAPPLGPRAIAEGVAAPKDADFLTKLSILAGYRAFFPLVGEAPTAAAAALAREWVSSSAWVRGKEGKAKLEEARATLRALLDAAAAVYPPVRQSLKESSEKLGALDAKGQAESMTHEQALAVMMARAKPLLHELWYLDKVTREDVAEERGTHMNLGQLSRRKQQAEAELAALQAAADGVSDKMGNALRAAVAGVRERHKELEEEERQRAEAKRREALTAAEAAARTPQIEKEGAGGGEGPEGEADAALLAQAAAEEEELWQLFLRHHEGVRDPVKRVLNKLRALFQRRAFKELMREALTALSGKSNEGHEGGSLLPLLPVEHHALQEWLALAALMSGHIPLALSSLDKADTPPPDSDPTALPSCFTYSPTALRTRYRALHAMEQGTKELQPSLEIAERAMAALTAIKEGDMLQADSALRAQAALNHGGLFYQMLNHTPRHDAPARLALCEKGLAALRAGLAWFEPASDDDATGTGPSPSLTEPSPPGIPPHLRLPRDRQLGLVVHLNRYLGAFYGEEALAGVYPDHLDRGVARYQEAVHGAQRLVMQNGPVPQLLHLLGTYRWELARMYHKRRTDETDWEAALLLLDQALEVFRDDEERATILRYKADALADRGNVQRSESELRAAAEAYEMALEHLERQRASFKPVQAPTQQLQMQLAQADHVIAATLRNAAQVYRHLAEMREEELVAAQAAAGGDAGAGGEAAAAAARGGGGADQDRAINRLERSFELYKRLADSIKAAGVQTNLLQDAASIAMMLARLHMGRASASATKRRKSVDAAIQWYEAAEDAFRRAAPGRDKDNKYANAYVIIYGALAALFTERAGLRKAGDKKEEAAKEADLKQAAVYGGKHQGAQRTAQGRAEATAALAAEKLKEIKL